MDKRPVPSIISDEDQLRQFEWRRSALRVREAAGKLTAKNVAEMLSLGMKPAVQAAA